MAEESRSGRGGRGNENAGRRRRYFKRRGEQAKPTEGEARPQAGSSANEKARNESTREPHSEFRVSHEEERVGAGSRNRTLRKRRRSRTRRGETPAAGGLNLPAARDEEYVAPRQVYIYEHVVRPSAGGYEFRGESFSKAGRTLDDYQLDLDIVFNPPPREPVGQIVARVLAEYEAADALEAARSGLPRPLEGEPTPIAPGGEGVDEATRWTARDPHGTAAERAPEESDDANDANGANEANEPPTL